MSQLFTLGGQSIRASWASVLASVLPVNIQGWFPLGWTGLISLQSKDSQSLLQHCSSKTSILWRSAFFASLVAQLVKNLPAMQETRVQFLGGEDPLENGTATHSSIPAWRIPWIEEPGGLQFMGPKRVGHDWATNTFTFTLSTTW